MNKFGKFLIFLSFLVLCVALYHIVEPFKKIAEHNDKVRISDLLKISQALEKYHQDYGHYPYDKELVWGAAWGPYMAILPKDPSWSKKYVYVSDNSDGFQSYRLYASLDNPAFNLGVCGVSNECPNVPAKNACGAPCNFAVTSSNTSP